MLTVRDVVLLAVLFAVIMTGTYLLVDRITAPRSPAVVSAAAPPTVAAPADLDRRLGLMFGADGHFNANVRNLFRESCEAAAKRDPAVRKLLSDSALEEVCNCAIDWTEAKIRNREFSYEDMQKMSDAEDFADTAASRELTRYMKNCIAS